MSEKITMIKIRQTTHAGNRILDHVNLPEAAQQELLTFYEFLLYKYQSQIDRSEKQRILSTIFQQADGKLPLNYLLNREELNER